jgi:ankyrin repeat protein
LSLSNASAQSQSTSNPMPSTSAPRVAAVELINKANGHVSGTVKDQNGAIISGATVTLVNNRSGASYVYVTNDDGTYNFAMLENGEYTLNAEASSFAKSESIELKILDDSPRTIGITLGIAEITEQVEITAPIQEFVVMGGGGIRLPEDPFIKAAFRDDIAALVELIQEVRDINASDKATDMTALSYAIENGNLDMVHILISAGALPNAANSKGETPLMFLTHESSREFVGELLRLGADAKGHDDQGRTVLMDAARVCKPEVINELIELGAKPDARDNEGNTVLMAAAENEDDNVLQLLIKHRVPVDYRNNDGQSAVVFAILAGHGNQLKTLLDAGATMSLTKLQLNAGLIVATRGGDLLTTKILVDYGADANAKDDTGTALMYAAENGNPQMLKLLIDAGADVDAVDDDGWTAMMHADAAENVRVLVNAGANFNIRNNDGQTALAMAIKYDQPEIVALLKSRGAPE